MPIPLGFILIELCCFALDFGFFDRVFVVGRTSLAGGQGGG